ncbi:HTTM domain-containing protein [Pontibacter sp. 13R65]|uniref:HTTM domain-containing protein n=1 Tax=Pontibacter sp. 13R65 TaxID=3127458 RepID=UPI00301D8A87
MGISIKKPDRLSLFIFLWAVANLFHILAYPGELSKPIGFLIALCALLLVLKPKYVIVFILMIGLRIFLIFNKIPSTSNHFILDLAVNTGIFLSFVMAIFPYVKEGSFTAGIKKIDREKLFNTFAPVARWCLLILYFFAVLHKLNWDYLNPAVSCATWYLDVFRNSGFSFIPDNQFIQQASVYGSLVCEAGILLLLFFRKTRVLGILLGLAFHFLLSLDPNEGMFSFVVMLYSLYFLFTPPDFTEKLYTVLTGLLNGKSAILKVFVPLGAIGFLIVLVILGLAKYDHPLRYFPFTAWYVWGMIVIIMYITVAFTQYNDDTHDSNFFRIRSSVLWIVPILLIFNGLSPYFGLKTQYSFSMFSNLRTEGGVTNHLFIPTSLHLTPWQEDLVEVAETDLEQLGNYTNGNTIITFFEFKRVVSKAVEQDQNFYVKYTRNGEENFLNVQRGVSNISEATTKHPWYLAKFVRFRRIDKGPCLCKH